MPEAQCGFDAVPGGASGSELLMNLGPTIMVDIGFDKQWNTKMPSAPIPGIKGVRALVDTGATESCIDDLLAVQLNLPVFDERPIGGVGGKHMVKMYLAQIRIPVLGSNIVGAFAGVHLQAGGQTHKALIGRTFLQHLTMTYDGKSGKVTLRLG
ncbi:MAG: hypothetical protein JNK10_06375 [Cyclobacteriaceae bacterium]|nr:hypothetical protein [Cyclobacteriaceae bacterium]